MWVNILTCVAPAECLKVHFLITFKQTIVIRETIVMTSDLKHEQYLVNMLCIDWLILTSQVFPCKADLKRIAMCLLNFLITPVLYGVSTKYNISCLGKA